MKGRGYADGCPQQEYITKEESSSFTVSICPYGSMFNRCNGQKESDNRQHTWNVIDLKKM